MSIVHRLVIVLLVACAPSGCSEGVTSPSPAGGGGNGGGEGGASAEPSAWLHAWGQGGWASGSAVSATTQAVYAVGATATEGTYRAVVISYDLDGALRWARAVAPYQGGLSRLSVDAGGVWLITSPWAWRFDDDGQLRCRLVIPDTTARSMALLPDGDLLLGLDFLTPAANFPEVVRLSAEGQVRYAKGLLESCDRTQVSVAPNGASYWSCITGGLRVLRIDPATGESLWQQTYDVGLNSYFSEAALVADDHGVTAFTILRMEADGCERPQRVLALRFSDSGAQEGELSVRFGSEASGCTPGADYLSFAKGAQDYVGALAFGRSEREQVGLLLHVDDALTTMTAERLPAVTLLGAGAMGERILFTGYGGFSGQPQAWQPFDELEPTPTSGSLTTVPLSLVNVDVGQGCDQRTDSVFDLTSGFDVVDPARHDMLVGLR